jgi:NADH-quinone oxidoreductase subunit H
VEFYLTYLLLAIALFAFIALFTLAGVYAERKLAGFIQDRYGPMETGPKGTLQTLADILKLIQKESIIPEQADKNLFKLAPILLFIAVYLGYTVIPWTQGGTFVALPLGLFFIMAILSMDAIGILMAGWGSNNKFSLIGALRSVAQIVSYEIPAGFALLSVAMIAQSFDLQEIVNRQGISSSDTQHLFGLWEVQHIGGFLTWHIFQAPHLLLAFVIFFIASLAQCNRAPFDIPEAESELVAGFHTEYTGLRFAFLMLSEYALMLLVSLISTALFLGGWNTVFPNIGPMKLADWTSGFYWGVFWTLSKAFALVGVQIWIRWTLPRLRADQLMQLCWKILLPLSFLCMALSGLWKIWVVS